MKRLIVCGDSFMSPVMDEPGTHFSEIFAKQSNFDLTVYARSAISNGGIILQLQEAIRQKPDLIIFNATNHDRIEFPKNDDDLDHTITLNDLSYANYTRNLSANTNNFNGSVISENLTSLLSDSYMNKDNLTPEKLKAIKLWFKELYISAWKHQLDCMAMYAIMHKLHRSSIPYMFVHDYLGMTDVDWMEEKNNIHPIIHEFRLLHKPTDPDPGYHTSFKVQEDIAEFVINHYNKYFKPVV